MKKILLLGDSIRLSYRQRVQELLDGKAEITGPDDNCRFSAYTLFNLRNWVGDANFDVIHWNNGQWDTCHMADGQIHTPLDQYLKTQKRIFDILKTKATHLIFSTTTPVKGDLFKNGDACPRKNEDISAYNHAVVEMLKKEGVQINDFYTPVMARLDECICDDLVHLTPTGVEVCAQQLHQAMIPLLN